MPISDAVLAHELDAAWTIALWLATHVGDPAPETVAAQAMAEYCSTLAGKKFCVQLPTIAYRETAA